MIKINGVYLEKTDNNEFKGKEWNKEKEMFYISTYTEDELEMFFNIKREDL